MEPDRKPPPSARKIELIDAAYSYVLAHGMGDLSLRPLASAIGSSPRVLLYLFGSKDDLIRALLARARAEEIEMLGQLRHEHPDLDLVGAVSEVWGWLSDRRRRDLLILWVEAYARSLVDPTGPWSGFAEQTVRDWLKVLGAYQSRDRRTTAAARSERTAALALLRGALLDLLATGDRKRVGDALDAQLARLALS